MKRDAILLGLAIGVVILRLSLMEAGKPIYEEGQRVKVSGRLVQAPQTTSWNQTLKVAGFMVSVPRWPEYNLGDRVEIIGTIGVNKSIKSDKFNKSYELNSPEIRMINSNDLLGWAVRVRKRAEEIYRRVLPEPQASFLAGIVWGGNKGLPEELVTAFKNTGTMHVMAASGMNVSLVAQFLIYILVIFLNRRWAIVVALIVIWIYVAISGLSASVVRAGIMGSILFSAQIFGRPVDGIRVLVVAGALMLILRPEWLTDVGWQLSIAATGGLLLTGRKVVLFEPQIARLKGERRAVEKSKNKNWYAIKKFLGGNFRTSVVATAATLPIMLANFGQISLVGPIVNALVLEMVGPLMMTGFLLFLAGLMWLPLAQIIGWVGWALATVFLGLVGYFGKIGWGTLNNVEFEWWWGAVYYVVLLALYKGPTLCTLTKWLIISLKAGNLGFGYGRKVNRAR